MLSFLAKPKAIKQVFLCYSHIFPVSQRDNEDPFNTNSIRREEQSTEDKNIGVGSQVGFKTQLPHILAVSWLFPFRIVRILELTPHKKVGSGRLKI